MKGHSSSARGADGISVEVCHPYVVGARRGMLFEQTEEFLPSSRDGAARMRDVGKRRALVLVCGEKH